MKNYSPADGITMTVPPGKRLRWALKAVGMKKLSRYAYFREGGRVSPWAALMDGDEITCLRLAGGG